ncbi:hypothetical protein B0H11DRAFT_1922798 [Mycena galericulata]|nr:hypothetical protein B0H11DRAFT_1922798 [Mycena galericulata]
MSPISESSTSLFSAALPTSTTKFILITSILACFGFIIHAISPARLTRVLLSALAAAEDSYIQAVEGRSFHHCQYHAATAERLASTSNCALRCIREVRALETDMEILKEGQLRELSLEAAMAAVERTISMRRRL